MIGELYRCIVFVKISLLIYFTVWVAIQVIPFHYTFNSCLENDISSSNQYGMIVSLRDSMQWIYLLHCIIFALWMIVTSDKGDEGIVGIELCIQEESVCPMGRQKGRKVWNCWAAMFPVPLAETTHEWASKPSPTRQSVSSTNKVPFRKGWMVCRSWIVWKGNFHRQWSAQAWDFSPWIIVSCENASVERTVIALSVKVSAQS